MEGQSAAEPRSRGKLVGREQEAHALRDLLDALRRGQSRALVVRGDAGVGKTALLDQLAADASGCRVVGVSGVEAEVEVAFAALHQLCSPLLDRLAVLPAPQREALEVTLGTTLGPAPDRLLVGLAVLSLLAEVATERPLLAVVDDAQWLDQASAQTVAFVARRLGAESVGIVVGTRHPGPEWAGVPELIIEGLGDHDARTLVASVLTVPMDERVLDQFVADTHGNPLALLELPRGLTAAELAGGFGLPAAGALSGSIEESFARRIAKLPAQTQRLLLVAAADPLGDPVLLWRAAERLGIEATAGRPAVEDGLVSLGARVRFRHPLVRSVTYRRASPEDRRAAHAALAEVTDAAVDPERRAWHRAEAAAGPDEAVAVELERYADLAMTRGGMAAAAAFLERATMLSRDPVARAARALATAQAKVQAGAFSSALDLLALAESGPLGELGRARVGVVRAQLAFATNHGSDAPALLLRAAQRLEPIDVELARATYLDALLAAIMAGRFAGSDGMATVARAAATAPPSRDPGPLDLLLDGLAVTFSEGYAAGVPLLRAAVMADPAGMPPGQELRWLVVAWWAAAHLWDDARELALGDRYMQFARDVGALSELALGIDPHAVLLFMIGEPGAAAAELEESYAAKAALGSGFVSAAMALAAWRGHEAEASHLIAIGKASGEARGEESTLTGAAWAEAVLYNGLGRYPEALAAALRAVESPEQLGLHGLALTELIEAAARAGKSELAADARRELAEMAAASGTSWAVGIETRARALACRDEIAEKLHRESIDHLANTRMRAQLARAHLLFGEWLRRERRRADARAELYIAVQMLDAMGMEAFAERARRELRATGETARKRSDETRGDLTAQEAQVATLAREGLSNPEIAARLYISARTVQYHLGKVFTKLGITSRSQLDRALG